MSLGEGGITEPKTAQRLGTLVGADFLIFGAITQFSIEDSIVGTEGMRIQNVTVSIAVDLRIADAKTGEIKKAQTIQRTQTKRMSILTDSFRREDSNAGIIGEVFRELANELVEKIAASVYPIRIQSLSGKQVLLNYGAPVILSKGLYRCYNEDDFGVGQIRITEVREKNSQAEIIDGQVEVGMQVRRIEGAEVIDAPTPKSIPW